MNRSARPRRLAEWIFRLTLILLALSWLAAPPAGATRDPGSRPSAEAGR